MVVVVVQDRRSRMWTRSREQFRPRENFHSHSQLTLGRTSSKSSSTPRSLPTHISPNTLSLLALILPKHSHYLWWRSISLGIRLHSLSIEGFQWARGQIKTLFRYSHKINLTAKGLPIWVHGQFFIQQSKALLEWLHWLEIYNFDTKSLVAQQTWLWL